VTLILTMKRLNLLNLAPIVAGLFVVSIPALAQNHQARAVREAAAHPPGIASISVCSPDGAAGQGSCPNGKLDTGWYPTNTKPALSGKLRV
jgi:hypothetical protein